MGGELYGFGWLRHLRAADSGITRANARALVDEWISHQGGWHPLAWRTDVLARRVISWISQAPLILQDVDAPFYRRFMRSLTQAGALPAPQRVRSARRRAASAGHDRADVCDAVHGQPGAAHQARPPRSSAISSTRRCCPMADISAAIRASIIELLLDLLPLKQAFTSRNMPPPPQLLNAIDRMMPMLRFFRHDDGNFALFNGMGATGADLIATILAYDDVRGEPVSNASHSGYQRLKLNNLLVIMDTGTAPPMAREPGGACRLSRLRIQRRRPAHRGQLRRCRSINRESWRQVARATAGAFDRDLQQCLVLPLPRGRARSARSSASPIVDGPSRVAIARSEHGDSHRAARLA